MLGTIQGMWLMAWRLTKLQEGGTMTHEQASLVKAWTTLRGREVGRGGWVGGWGDARSCTPQAHTQTRTRTRTHCPCPPHTFPTHPRTHPPPLALWQVVALGRELLGGNGILSDFLVAKAFCDLEASGLGVWCACIRGGGGGGQGGMGLRKRSAATWRRAWRVLCS